MARREKSLQRGLEALRRFTLAVLRNRGEVADADLEAFYAAGYEQHHVLEVILGCRRRS